MAVYSNNHSTAVAHSIYIFSLLKGFQRLVAITNLGFVVIWHGLIGS